MGEMRGRAMPGGLGFAVMIFLSRAMQSGDTSHGERTMSRWVRLWSAFIGMVMIGNLQYAWTLFAEPMVKAHAAQHWQLSEVQWGFGLFIAAGTWAMPFFASYIDKIGPRFFMIASGVLCAIGWGALGQVSSLISF